MNTNDETTFDLHLFQEFFDWQPQAFVWLSPVWDSSGATIVDFLYVYSNAVGLSYLKLKPEMLGKIRISNTPSLSDEMRPLIIAEMRRVYESGETVSINLYNPVLNTYGRVYRIKFRGGVLTTIQDKTEEQKAIQQLSERTRELQRSNENLEEFAYAASHDLQEPLRKISAFSEMLRQDLQEPLTVKQVQVFGRLQASLLRMKTLIDDLLLYSRVSQQRSSFQEVDLAEIVGGVLQDLESSVEESKAQFNITTLPKLQGDASQLRQLFQNLFSNAIKYRKPSERLQVVVGCRNITATEARSEGFSADEARRYFLVYVQDNGIGFEPEYEARIFQLFQRLHGRSEYEGSGIGLALVKKVVANHKGYIKAIGKPGIGATFVMLLPAD